jgi:hypothetical protein
MAQTITKIAAIFNKKTSSNLWPNGAETDQRTELMERLVG